MVTLIIWTLVATGGDRVVGFRQHYDWRPVMTFDSAYTKQSELDCHAAAKRLEVKKYECIRSR